MKLTNLQKGKKCDISFKLSIYMRLWSWNNKPELYFYIILMDSLMMNLFLILNSQSKLAFIILRIKNS